MNLLTIGQTDLKLVPKGCCATYASINRQNKCEIVAAAEAEDRQQCEIQAAVDTSFGLRRPK